MSGHRRPNHATSSSFSRALDLEKCPLFFKMRHIDKIPDPAPPLPSGQERPLERGNRLHSLGENYVLNKLLPFPEEFKAFEKELKAFRKLFQAGKLTPEKRFAFDKTWNLCDYKDWDNVIYRAVADVSARLSDTRVLVIDYKSGKKKGNEVKHHEQAMEYAVCEALVDPEIQLFNVEIWYLDQQGDNKLRKQFTRSQVLSGFNAMKQRHQRVLEERFFEARPSRYACAFCPYKAGDVGFGKLAYPGTGHCRRNAC